LIFQLGSLALAGFLTYLALRKTNLGDIAQAFRQADYWWCIPLVVLTLGSHWLRAWRWQALLMTLPQARRRISLTNAFSSVMIGLMVNYVLPRAGEFVRSGNLARREKLSFSGVLGTIVTERVIDIISLALGVGLSSLLLTGMQRASLHDTMLQPAIERFASLPLVSILLGLVAVSVLAWWILSRASVKSILQSYIAPVWISFKDGLTAAHRSQRRPLLILTTVGMWSMYALMAYISLEIFDIAQPYDLTLADGVVIMFLGALGIVLPTPGGLGPFHFITILILTVFYGVPESLAGTYAVFVHGSQLLLYLALGLLIIAFQDRNFSRIRIFQQMRDRDANSS